MPNKDKTGPLGQGPVTGRGMGSCGKGMGWGRGYGFGLCRKFSTPKDETEALRDAEKILEEELKAVKERLAEIKS